MERQKARWRHARCAKKRDCRDWVLQMTLKKLSHFMWHLVYTDNFLMRQFLFGRVHDEK